MSGDRIEPPFDCICFAAPPHDNDCPVVTGFRRRPSAIEPPFITRDLCFGCRAITGARRVLSDMFPAAADLPPTMRWEQFECVRCGVPDVRVVTVDA